GGFLPKHLYTLSGPTNGGKTSLACNFADALRKQGRRVLYIALEPDINVVSILASVRLNKRFSELTEDELTYDEGLIDVLLQEDVKGVSQLVPIIKNTGHNYSLIVIDHIGYFVSSENNTAQNQANILKLLAMLAKQLQTAVLVIAHPRKDVGKYMTVDDIAGSAAFKQDSTEVLLLHRFKEKEDDELDPTYKLEAMISVPKTKTGNRKATCKIWFQEHKAKILGSEHVYQESFV